MAAAQGRGAPDDQRQEQAAQLGLDAEAARAWIASQQTEDAEDKGAEADSFWAGPEEPFPVWPENWPALQVWMTVQGSWHRTWRGRLLGLRWDEVEAVIRLGRMRKPRRLLRHLREMQAEAVNASNGE